MKSTPTYEGIYSDSRDVGEFEAPLTWKLPCWGDVEGNKSVKRANKYLQHMQKRAKALQKAEKNREIWFIGDFLLRKSTSFQMLCYHKSNYGWYWKLSPTEILRQLRRQIDIARRKHISLKINRTYIPKKDINGIPTGKMRPIGAPEAGDKAVAWGLNEILKLILEPKIGLYQHGFMTGRKLTDASLKVWRAAKDGKHFFQFDLKGFFNEVNVKLVCGRLNNLAKGLGKWIEGMTYKTYPKIKEYHPETEVERHTREGITYYRRKGFVQGLPFSPLLCNYALELSGIGETPGLVQYADDGLIIRDEQDITEFPETAKTRILGLKLAEKNLGWSTHFKFLGITYDTTNRMMRSDLGETSFDSDKAEEFIKKSTGGYPERKKSWYWTPSPDSLLSYRGLELKGKLLRTEHLDGNRVEYFSDGVRVTTLSGIFTYQPEKESTIATIELLAVIKELNKRRKSGVRGLGYNGGSTIANWTECERIKGKIWVRTPSDWLSLHAEDRAWELIKKLGTAKPGD